MRRDTAPIAQSAAMKTGPDHVLARVERFSVAAPKFTKDSWGNGEGGGLNWS
jgi:hypothetical protein